MPVWDSAEKKIAARNCCRLGDKKKNKTKPKAINENHHHQTHTQNAPEMLLIRIHWTTVLSRIVVSTIGSLQKLVR